MKDLRSLWEVMITNRDRTISYVLALLALLILLIWNIKEYRETRFIFSDYSLTMGWITSYDENVYNSTHRLEYSYVVNRIRFSRSIHPSIRFDRCVKDFSLCDSMKFCVIYSNKDPEKSRINLHRKVCECKNDIIEETCVDLFE